MLTPISQMRRCGSDRESGGDQKLAFGALMWGPFCCSSVHPTLKSRCKRGCPDAQGSGAPGQMLPEQGQGKQGPSNEHCLQEHPHYKLYWFLFLWGDL